LKIEVAKGEKEEKEGKNWRERKPPKKISSLTPPSFPPQKLLPRLDSALR
jgi:hypothetical protein